MDLEFSVRADGQVDLHLGPDWPIFNEALSDSISSLPPRGARGNGPSTYWIDVAEAGVLRALETGDTRPFTGGNVTLLKSEADQVVATFDFSDDVKHHVGAARVASDVDRADLSSVSGTPTFFVNGRRHHGAFDIQSLTAAVQGRRRPRHDLLTRQMPGLPSPTPPAQPVPRQPPAPATSPLADAAIVTTRGSPASAW